MLREVLADERGRGRGDGRGPALSRALARTHRPLRRGAGRDRAAARAVPQRHAGHLRGHGASASSPGWTSRTDCTQRLWRAPRGAAQGTGPAEHDGRAADGRHASGDGARARWHRAGRSGRRTRPARSGWPTPSCRDDHFRPSWERETRAACEAAVRAILGDDAYEARVRRGRRPHPGRGRRPPLIRRAGPAEAQVFLRNLATASGAVTTVIAAAQPSVIHTEWATGAAVDQGPCRVREVGQRVVVGEALQPAGHRRRRGEDRRAELQRHQYEHGHSLDGLGRLHGETEQDEDPHQRGAEDHGQPDGGEEVQDRGLDLQAEREAHAEQDGGGDQSSGRPRRRSSR